MSDEGGDEFDVEWPDDDENQGGDDDGGPMVELQNTYYTAEDIKRQKPREALEMFETAIMLSEALGDDEVKYRFQSLQNIVTLSAQLGELDNMLSKQRALLKMVNKVAREDLAEAVNAVLDAVANYLGH